MTFLQRIAKVTPYYKIVYFMWKHKLKNRKTDFREFSEEFIIDKYFKGEQYRFDLMLLWEKSEEYAELMYYMLKEKKHNDFIEIYNIVCDNAKTGDERAIKTFLSLQKELERNLKSLSKNKTVEETENEDDDLVI